MKLAQFVQSEPPAEGFYISCNGGYFGGWFTPHSYQTTYEVGDAEVLESRSKAVTAMSKIGGDATILTVRIQKNL